MNYEETELKILFIVNNVQGKGGVERVLKDLANSLSFNYDYKIKIYSILSDGYIEDLYTYDKKIEIIHLNKKKVIDQSLFFTLKKELMKNDHDYIVSCSTVITALAFLANIFNGNKSKIISWEHSQFNNISTSKKFLRHMIYPFIYRVISQTQYDSQYYLKKLCKAQAIPNPLGIEINETSHLKNKKCIAIGRLEKEKGFDTLIKIVRNNKEKFDGWEINIFGEGSLKESLNALIQESELEKIVSIHDFKNNISDEIVDSSILISTSITESFSMVLVEAMACGVPVISFDCPSGPREIIDDNKNGFLIKNFNEVNYMDKLQILMDSESLRKEFGENGKSKALNFDIKKITSMWKEVLKSD